MTLVRSEQAALFFVDPPPQTGKLADTNAWLYETLTKLQGFLRRPEFSAVVYSKLDSIVAPEFKPESGMMVYAGAGTLGPQEGFYVYEGRPGAGGSWKKLAGT